MKNLLLLSLILTISACADLSSIIPNSGTSDTSARSKMQTCMLSEAQSRLQAGTLFNNTISATAKDIAGTCTKKLELESIGITEESQRNAENIISNLRNLNNN